MFRWKLIAAIFGVPFLVLSLINFGLRFAYTVRESIGRTEMYRRIEELRERGLPVDQNSLEENYHRETSDRENKAWESLLSELGSSEFKASTEGVPYLDPRIEGTQFTVEGEWQYEKKTIAFADQWEKVIETARNLASQDDVYGFPIHFDSLQTDLRSIQQLRLLARVIYVDGLVSLRQGNSLRTRKDIECLFDLSKIASRVPFSVAILVSVAIERLGIELTRNGVEWNQIAEQDLKALLPTLDVGLSIGTRWSDVMKAELGTAVPVFIEPNLSMKFKKQIPSRGYDCIAYLELMERAIDLDSTDFDALLEGARKLESDLRKLHVGLLPAMDHILAGVLAPTFESYAELFVEHASAHRLAFIAIKARLYKEQYNRFPRSLSELETVGDQWEPIGGKPFGYEAREEQAVLWGFQIKEYSACPSAPPSTIGETRSAENNRAWIWILQP